MSYKKDFIKFMCDAGVLTFGEFTLKSGRKLLTSLTLVTTRLANILLS